MGDSGKAVFLSYASQDAEAARRIAEALRAAGLEVWFDQNELVGGDAWDQKIRGQINSCALFIPIISTTTQSRREAYFRLEWKLADERTHLMAEGTPFLLPVTIDDTSDRGALVPNSFRAVQWTRLPIREAQGREPSKESPERTGAQTLAEDEARVLARFVAHVQRLLAEPAEKSASAASPRFPSDVRSASAWRLPWHWVFAGAVAAVLLFGIISQRSPELAVNAASADPRDPGQNSSTAHIDRTLAKGGDATRAELRVAVDLAQTQTKEQSADAESWARLSLSNRRLYLEYDRTPDIREQARRAAETAISLNPTSLRARLAQAVVYSLSQRTADEAERRLRDLIELFPDEPEPMNALMDHYVLINDRDRFGDFQRREYLTMAERVLELRPDDPMGLHHKAWALIFLGRQAEAFAIWDDAIARAGSPYALLHKFWQLSSNLGDDDAARQVLVQFPIDLSLRAMAVRMVGFFGLRRGEPAMTLTAVEAFPYPMVEDLYSQVPRGYLAGKAREQLGQLEAAKVEWRRGLQVCQDRLATEPNNLNLLNYQVRLHHLLGHTEEEKQSLELLRQYAGNNEYDPIFELGMEQRMIQWVDSRLDQARAEASPSAQLRRQKRLLKDIQGWSNQYPALKLPFRFLEIEAELTRELAKPEVSL